uniref:Uncharacterized protein n=1 Tax=Arundo donax TaxID=35708 RepID=A0A0A8ZFX9_ARUDO
MGLPSATCSDQTMENTKFRIPNSSARKKKFTPEFL